MQHFHIAVVGNGLSATRFFIEYSRKQTLGKGHIALIGPAANLATGIPYGPQTDPAALLIEPLAGTQCPPFTRWVHDHIGSCLDDYRRATGREPDSPDPDSIHWPRHTFGRFSLASYREARACYAPDQQLQEIDACVVDIDYAINHYLLRLDDGRMISAQRVVMATGSIAKPPHADSPHFLLDQFSRQDLLHDKMSALLAATRSPLRVATLGSNASAVETLYLLRRYYTGQIASIEMLSDTGFYPVALENEEFGGTPVSWLPCCKEYADAAFAWLAEGKLALRKLTVRDVLPESTRSFVVHDDGLRDYDLVIDCRGAGKTFNSQHSLIRQLSRKPWLHQKANGRGYEMIDAHRIRKQLGLFVIGPLQNDDDVASHVESIRGVFQSAQALATLLTDVQPLALGERR